MGAHAQTQYPGDGEARCKGYIDVTCSCTHGACREVRDGEVTQLDFDKYQLNSTGEKFSRRGWAEDGIATICQWKPKDEWWEVGPGNPVKCYYPARGPGS